MSLDTLLPGTAVLIAANLLIYAVQGVSLECRRLLSRCVNREITGLLTAVGVAEFCHRRMMHEAQSLGLVASNPAKALGQNPALLRRLGRYAQEVEDLLDSKLTVLSVDASDIARALGLQRRHGLLTNDSLHLAAAYRAGVVTLATNDPHFDGIPELTIFKPGDLA